MEIIKLNVGPLRTNCYVLIAQGEAVVIDPGGDEESILSEINKHHAKLIYIINTHYHFDHTLANEPLKEKTGAKIIIHHDEKEFIDFKPDRFLCDGDEVILGGEKLKVIHTPGHSLGGICLVGEKIIFTGDTLFKDTYGITYMPGGSDGDLKNSLKLLQKIIRKGMHVYPGHGHDYVN